MAESGTTHVHSEDVYRDGVWRTIITRTTDYVIEYVDWRTQAMFGLYLLIVFLMFLASTWTDGVAALYDVRRSQPNLEAYEEVSKVRVAIAKRFWPNFLEALFVPYSFASNAVPRLIVTLHPKTP